MISKTTNTFRDAIEDKFEFSSVEEAIQDIKGGKWLL